MRRIKLERETVITFNEQDEMATVWSVSPIIVKRLQKMNFKGESRGASDGRYFLIPKKLVIIQKERKQRKTLSPEQVAIRRARMQQINTAV